jgi:hypothetical protein
MIIPLVEERSDLLGAESSGVGECQQRCEPQIGPRVAARDGQFRNYKLRDRGQAEQH